MNSELQLQIALESTGNNNKSSYQDVFNLSHNKIYNNTFEMYCVVIRNNIYRMGPSYKIITSEGERQGNA